MDERTTQLISDPPLPLLIKMAAPNSIAFIIQAGVSMTEVWFIGRLGTASLAAIALVFPLLMLIQTMSFGAMGGAMAAAVARSLGASDTERAERLIWHALVLSTLGALTFLTTFLLLGKPLLVLLGGSGDILTMATRYCLILFSGGVFIWLMGCLSAIFRGMGNMNFPALMMITNAFIQVPMSAVLVLGAFDFEGFGVVGAAISAVISSALISLIMLGKLLFGQTLIRIKKSRAKFSKDLFDDILRVFKPAALSPLLSVLTILSLTALVGRHSEEALAGYGIGSRIEFLIIPLVFGLGAAMTSLVGMSIGAKNIQRAQRIGWTGGLAAGLLAGFVGGVLALLPEYWIPVFTDNPLVYEAAQDYIQIVGPAYLFFGLGLSLYFASQGAGAMRWPIIATFVRFLIAVGGAAILANFADVGLKGIFYASAAGMTVYGCMIAGSLKLGAWRQSD